MRHYFVLNTFSLNLTLLFLDLDTAHLQVSGNTKILHAPLIVTFKVSYMLPAQLLQGIKVHYSRLVKYFGNTIDKD